MTGATRRTAGRSRKTRNPAFGANPLAVKDAACGCFESMDMKTLPKVLVLLLLAAPASAQTRVVIVGGGPSLLDNQFLFNAGEFTRTQRVLTSAKPLLTSLGPGKTTVLFAADGTVTGGAIQTENFPTAVAWRAPEVSNVYVNGQYTVSESTDSGVLEVADGIRLSGDGQSIPKVMNVEVANFRGDGIESRPWGFVRNVYAHNCFTGIRATGADQMITDNMASECRDYCGYSDGSNQTWHGNHFWGAKIASMYISSIGAENRYTNEAYKDGATGLWCDGENNAFVACNISQNYQWTAQIRGVGNSFTDCTFHVSQDTAEHDVKGIEIIAFATRTTIRGGSITLTTDAGGGTPAGPAAYGLSIASHDDIVEGVRLVDVDGYNGSKGIVVTGAVKGARIDIKTYGFHASNDRIITFDNAGIKDCHVVITGMAIDTSNGATGLDISNVEKYIDIPAGWDASNSIEFRNSLTGTSEVLTPTQAY